MPSHLFTHYFLTDGIKATAGWRSSLPVRGVGTYICAACIHVGDASHLVIDLTLYWQVVPDEKQAWFVTGMLNSNAMSQAILPFSPIGAFGERHIHSLPYRLMPLFDAANEDHTRIAIVAEHMVAQAHTIIVADAYLHNPNRILHLRRRKVRERLQATAEFTELETQCASALGIEVPSPEDLDMEEV